MTDDGQTARRGALEVILQKFGNERRNHGVGVAIRSRVNPRGAPGCNATHCRQTPCIAVFGLVAVLLTNACDTASAPVRTVTRDSAGVHLVESDATVAPLGWSYSRVARMEGTPGTPFHSVYATGVAFAADGDLFVLDGGDQQIHAFDATGAYRHTFGRQGEGPGEFQLATALYVRSDTVIVHDAAARHFVRFTTAGEFVGIEPAAPGMNGAFAYVGPALAFLVRGVRDGARIIELRTVTDSVSINVVAAADTLTRSVHYESCGVMIGLAPMFAPELRWAVGSELIAVSQSPGYSIELYHRDSLVSAIRRDLAPPRATEEYALNRLGDGEEWTVGSSRTCTIPPEEVLEKRGMYPVVSLIRRIAFDPGGYLWVERERLSDSPAIDVLHPEQGYLGTLPDGAPWPDAFGPGDRFVSVERDSLDVPTVNVYSIAR